uniref:Uncharacterized protein n=1 Tax=Lepeophtheirus salmonis TaxID=72036 RepID=A0A0K2VD00_LEPSM
MSTLIPMYSIFYPMVCLVQVQQFYLSRFFHFNGLGSFLYRLSLVRGTQYKGRR